MLYIVLSLFIFFFFLSFLCLLNQVANPEALGFEVGQEIKVKYFGNDPVSGFMRLSRKMITNTASDVTINLNK